MKSITHWCKPKKLWSNHTYKSCAKSPVVLIIGEWHAETKPLRKTNPRGWIVAEHTQVIVDPAPEVLERFQKTEPLRYDKEKVEFNHSVGQHLLFDTTGCHLVKEVNK